MSRHTSTSYILRHLDVLAFLQLFILFLSHYALTPLPLSKQFQKSWISRNSPSRKALFVGPLSNLLLLMESAGRTRYNWIWILVTCQWPFFFGLYVPWAMAPRSCNAHISFNLTLILARTTQLPALGAITQKCNTFFFSCHFILLPSILKALFSVFDHKGPILPVQAGNFSYFGSFAIWQKSTLLLDYHWLSIMKWHINIRRWWTIWWHIWT